MPIKLAKYRKPHQFDPRLGVIAAAGVFGTGSGWPDLVVAVIMAGLALSSGITVMRQSNRELTLNGYVFSRQNTDTGGASAGILMGWYKPNYGSMSLPVTALTTA